LGKRGPVDGEGDTHDGYWGVKNANVNWCEEDYVFTEYVAELINSLSSLTIVLNGIYGYWAHPFAETRFKAAFTAMWIVGFGSCAFHGTLWRSMQLLDELPMIWGNSIFIYILYTMEDKEDKTHTPLICILTVVTAIMTALVILFDTKTQDIFLMCYGLGVIYITYKSNQLNNKYNVSGVLLLQEVSLLSYIGHVLKPDPTPSRPLI